MTPFRKHVTKFRRNLVTKSLRQKTEPTGSTAMLTVAFTKSTCQQHKNTVDLIYICCRKNATSHTRHTFDHCYALPQSLNLVNITLKQILRQVKKKSNCLDTVTTNVPLTLNLLAPTTVGARINP
jgi:hypothetical protein